MRPPKPGLVLRFALPELRAIAAHVGGLPRFSGREPVGIVADRTRRPRVGSERIAKINALSSSGYGRDHVRVAVPFPMRMPAR